LVLYTASRAGTSFDLTGLAISPAVKLYPARLSLTDQASITALTTMVSKEHQGCDILINNAGLFYFQENITAAQRQETLDVNYRGTLNVGHRILFSFDQLTTARSVKRSYQSCGTTAAS
jgi:carbonyl reductase 1